MAYWLALAGLGMDAIGKEQGLAATVEGAETQAEIEKLGRDAGEKRFQKQIEIQKPFLDMGKETLSDYEASLKNKYDVTKSPLYKMQEKMILSGLGDASQDVKDDAIKKLGAREGELAKGRFLDLQKIGLGASASAGQTAMNFGSTFADSVSRGDGALATATLQKSMGRHNLWTGVAEDLSGYPAYRETSSYIGKKRARDYENSPEFVGPPRPN